jgi:D-alanyl-D-alanine carboxypeptidase
MHRCGRVVAPPWVVATLLVVLLCSALACSPDPTATSARGPGTTGTSRPRPAIATPVGEDPLPPALEERLQRTLDATRPTLQGTPGLIAGVWVPGVGAWASISVEADPKETEPLATNDHVRIGTVTASMTAMVVLGLVDEGRLTLDQPVSTVVPGRAPDGGGPAAASTTVRDVLRAAAGPEAATAAATLGEIVEAVVGQPVAQVIQDRVIERLRLQHTTLQAAGGDPLPRPFATGVPASTPSTFLPAVDAGVSTMLDLEIWAYHLGSGELLSPATFAAQRDLVRSTDPARPAQGLGVVGLPPPVQPAVEWIGSVGSTAGYSLVLAFDPATKAVIVVVATSDVAIPQADTASGVPVFRSPAEVAFAALRDVLRAAPPPTTVVTMPLPGTTMPR